ncbi:hypothetical protein BH23GEM5_BH23GEM5_03630 [soil metagenome]
MLPTSSSPTAAATLRQISEQTRGERARRAAAGALVLRAVEHRTEQGRVCAFGVARAGAELERLGTSREVSILRRLLLSVAADSTADVARQLADYAYHLERNRLPEADAALALARELAPENAEIALHVGRVARKLGDAERALAAYRVARDLDGATGAISRLAAIGEAVVSADAGAALGRAIRHAIRAGDREAAAVGLEERARVRRAAGDRRGCARDLCRGALRFTDGVDRARVAHALADVTLADADPAAAREALLAASVWGDPPQREHARARLHTLSRDLQDQVGMRRWRSWEPPALVSLSLRRRTQTATSLAPRLAHWRETLTGA